MQRPDEGREVSEISEAHLHEGNLEALAWERQVPKIKNTSYLTMTKYGWFQAQEKSFLFIGWLGCQI